MSNDLFEAVRQRDCNTVKKLLNEGADVNAVNEYGHTPLHFAAMRFKAIPEVPRVAEILINGGANVNAVNGYGNAPLHSAIYFKTTGVVKVLLKHGADVNAANRDGHTPRELAILLGHYDLARLVPDSGTSVPEGTKKPRSPEIRPPSLTL